MQTATWSAIRVYLTLQRPLWKQWIPALDAYWTRSPKQDGVALITADHGNADKMYEEDGSPFTAHTTNPVPFCVVGYPCKKLRKGGRLADIAPTMLQILGLPQPAEMDGRSLIEE